MEPTPLRPPIPHFGGQTRVLPQLCPQNGRFGGEIKAGTRKTVDERLNFKFIPSPELANTPASSSRQGLRARPKGSQTLLVPPSAHLCLDLTLSTDSAFSWTNDLKKQKKFKKREKSALESDRNVFLKIGKLGEVVTFAV